MEAAGIIDMLSPFLSFGRYSENMANIPAKCPFHGGGQERVPSFYVYVGPASPKKSPGASFCHRCNEGWSLVSLLKKLRAPARTIDQVQEYLRLITRPARRKATDGIDLDFEFQLPEALLGQWEFFPKKMTGWGFERSLVLKHEVGFDRLNKRITFPIRDHHGNFVGVSGRASRHWQKGRYRVYRQELRHLIPNYEFDKSRVLWGLDKFYETRMRSGEHQPTIVLCEGFKAKLWVEQAGIPHVLSPMGTFFSKEQIFLLTCISSSTILFLDHDQAGRVATDKQAKRLQREGLDVRVADYGTMEEISPDDLTADQVVQAVENNMSVRQWRRTYGQ